MQGHHAPIYKTADALQYRAIELYGALCSLSSGACREVGILYQAWRRR